MTQNIFPGMFTCLNDPIHRKIQNTEILKKRKTLVSSLYFLKTFYYEKFNRLITINTNTECSSNILQRHQILFVCVISWEFQVKMQPHHFILCCIYNFPTTKRKFSEGRLELTEEMTRQFTERKLKFRNI